MSGKRGVPGDAAVLRRQVALLQAANASLLAQLDDKDAKIAALEARIVRLERLISRNSGNSPVPPSGDDQPGRVPPEPRPARGRSRRRPGKQPGAPGAFLAWNQHGPDRGPVPARGLCVRRGPEGRR